MQADAVGEGFEGDNFSVGDAKTVFRAYEINVFIGYAHYPAVGMDSFGALDSFAFEAAGSVIQPSGDTDAETLGASDIMGSGF